MEDKLKKFVNENRRAFDNKQPSPLVWNRIKKDLSEQSDILAEQQDRVKRLKSTRIWYAAASVAAVMLLSGILWKQYYSSHTLIERNTDVRIAQQEKAYDKDKNPVISTEQSTILSKEDTDNGAESTYSIDARTATMSEINKASKRENDQPLRHETPDPVKTTYALLADENSAMNRMEGVLQLARKDNISEENMVTIQSLMANDPNENIRLAAYDVFMEYAPNELKNEKLQEVFLQQKDPTMQVEMMQAMAETDSLKINKATTQRLEAIIEDPLAMDLVKNQAYAVLMKNW